MCCNLIDASLVGLQVDQLVDVHVADNALCVARLTSARRTARGASNVDNDDDDDDDDDNDDERQVNFPTLVHSDLLASITQLCAPSSLMPAFARRNVAW